MSESEGVRLYRETVDRVGFGTGLVYEIVEWVVPEVAESMTARRVGGRLEPGTWYPDDGLQEARDQAAGIVGALSNCRAEFEALARAGGVHGERWATISRDLGELLAQVRPAGKGSDGE